MRKRMLVIAFCIGLAAPSLPDDTGRGRLSISGMEKEVHELVNQERKKQGRMPLEIDARLAGIARKHSEDMAKRDFFSHMNPEGQGPTERGKAAGYAVQKDYGTRSLLGLGENLFKRHLYHSIIYRGSVVQYNWLSQTTIAHAAVSDWMASPGHRKNILNAEYDRQGIGVAISEKRMEVYITEVFW